VKESHNTTGKGTGMIMYSKRWYLEKIGKKLCHPEIWYRE
jgi:hypothetical protein